MKKIIILFFVLLFSSLFSSCDVIFNEPLDLLIVDENNWSMSDWNNTEKVPVIINSSNLAGLIPNVTIPVVTRESITISGDGQTSFTLANIPTIPETSMLSLNGLVREYGVSKDFTITVNNLIWNEPSNLTLSTTDIFQIWMWDSVPGLGSFLPTDISGLQLWLDASDDTTITLNGSDVSQWDDKSDNGNDASQGTSADQPLYNLASINGLNTLELDGVSEFMDLNSVLPNSGDFTLFFVIDFPSNITTVSSSEQFLTAISDVRPLGTVFFGTSSPGGSLSLQGLNAASEQGFAVIADTITAGPHMFSARLSGSTTTISIDSDTKFVFDAGVSLDSTHSLKKIQRIGANRIPGDWVDANVGEIIYYDRALSTDERDSVETYLNNKWNTFFNPTSLSGLQLWLDASDDTTITLNGSDVSQWDDKSDNGNNATQGTSADQPLYNLASINGLNTLEFDGSTEYMDLDSILPNSGNYTLFFLVEFANEITSSSGNEYILTSSSAVLPRGSVIFGTGIGDSTFSSVGLDGGADQGWFHTEGSITTNTHVFSIKLSGGTTTVSMDGVTKTVTESQGGMDSTHSLKNIQRIGASLGLVNLLEANFGELIYYDRALETDEEEAVENYLLDKWAVEFNPLDVSGLQLWLDASDSDTITLNGTDVSNWADKSDNGNNASQGTAEDQPLYDLASINGLNSLQLDGVSEFLNLDSDVTTSGDFTVFIVLDLPSTITSTSPSQAIFSTGPGTPQPRTQLNFGPATGGFPDETLTITGLVNGAVFGFAYLKDNIPSGTRILMGSLLTSTTTFEIDGVTKTTFEGFGGLDPDETLAPFNIIGATSVPSGFLNASIAEIIYYDEALTDENRINVNNYLEAKWAIS